MLKKLKGIEKSERIYLILYILVLVSTAILVSNHGGAFFYILFFSTVLYIPVALIQILYTRIVLRVYQDVDSRLLFKGSAVPYQVSVGNAGPIPIGGISFVREEHITEFEKDFTLEEYKFLPKESINIDTMISCKYAGGYVAGIDRIVITDVFKILKISFAIPAPLRVHVLPAVTDVAVSDINHIFEDTSGRSRQIRLDDNDITPGNELRKYVPGDALSTVHWKNYARTREMYVRLPDKKESEMMTIVVIPDAAPTIEKRDYLLEYIVSATNWFAKQKKPIRIMYFCGSVKEYLVDNYNSFSIFYMERLMDFGSADNAPSPGSIEKITEAAFSLGSDALLFYEETGTLQRR